MAKYEIRLRKKNPNKRPGQVTGHLGNYNSQADAKADAQQLADSGVFKDQITVESVTPRRRNVRSRSSALERSRQIALDRMAKGGYAGAKKNPKKYRLLSTHRTKKAATAAATTARHQGKNAWIYGDRGNWAVYESKKKFMEGANKRKNPVAKRRNNPKQGVREWFITVRGTPPGATHDVESTSRYFTGTKTAARKKAKEDADGYAGVAGGWKYRVLVFDTASRAIRPVMVVRVPPKHKRRNPNGHTSATGRWDPSQEDLYGALWMIASNEGDSYRLRDTKGAKGAAEHAVNKAWRDHRRMRDTDERTDFRTIKPTLVKELAKRWKITRKNPKGTRLPSPSYKPPGPSRAAYKPTPVQTKTRRRNGKNLSWLKDQRGYIRDDRKILMLAEADNGDRYTAETAFGGPWRVHYYKGGKMPSELIKVVQSRSAARAEIRKHFMDAKRNPKRHNNPRARKILGHVVHGKTGSWTVEPYGKKFKTIAATTKWLRGHVKTAKRRNPSRLIAKRFYGNWVVVDPDGGVWYPNEKAQREIKASSKPGPTALRIADSQPRRGRWAS